MKSLIRFYSK